MGWINLFGLILVVMLLIPNVVYAIKVKDQTNQCTNKMMNFLEQVGRYGCMFLMGANIGVTEFGFLSVEAFLSYLFGGLILMVTYWIVWIFYFRKPTYAKQITLAILPTALFLLCGVTMRHMLLVFFGVIFGIGHIYVTSKNRV